MEWYKIYTHTKLLGDYSCLQLTQYSTKIEYFYILYNICNIQCSLYTILAGLASVLGVEESYVVDSLDDTQHDTGSWLASRRSISHPREADFCLLPPQHSFWSQVGGVRWGMGVEGRGREAEHSWKYGEGGGALKNTPSVRNWLVHTRCWLLQTHAHTHTHAHKSLF